MDRLVYNQLNKVKINPNRVSGSTNTPMTSAAGIHGKKTAENKFIAWSATQHEIIEEIRTYDCSWEFALPNSSGSDWWKVTQNEGCSLPLVRSSCAFRLGLSRRFDRSMSSRLFRKILRMTV